MARTHGIKLEDEFKKKDVGFTVENSNFSNFLLLINSILVNSKN